AFAAENVVAAQNAIISQLNSELIVSFGIQYAIFIDDAVVSDFDFVGMADRNVASKSYIPSNVSKNPGIKKSPQRIAECATARVTKSHHEFVFEEFPQRAN